MYNDFHVPSPDEDVSLRIVTTEFTSAQYNKLAPEVKKRGAEVLAVPATQIKFDLMDWMLETKYPESEWEPTNLAIFLTDYEDVFPNGLPISIPLPAAAVGKDVAVVHYVDGAWKREAATVNGRQLTTYMASLSPVAIVWAEDEAVNVDLPKTGDDSNVILWTALAFVSLIGMAMLAYKRKEA